MSTPPLDLKPYEAFLASLRVWVLDVAAALLEVLGPRRPISRDIALLLRDMLGAAETDLKRAILALAIARLNLPTKRRHRFGGYAYRRWRPSYVRLLTHSTFASLRGHSIRTRIARLRGILENLELWIARLMKRLRRGFDGMHIILAAPPVAHAYAGATHAPALADSS